ncbi:phosphatase PAP2 family protein [Actinoplanes utahensis]|uniref:Phosphoesterase n=1 Tax=Actinoplanes utahensis TaxID=1869 RepID=A0A0A6X1L8_ACTUT|nr:phosphatase PAP2 family protein [Actinoplanes utahensis]KHD73997.1 phosphoesterase [Actinoplanes utahensis]GIF27740.1 phosphatidic acid phosphatase [Actinoplanes utahensis]
MTAVASRPVPAPAKAPGSTWHRLTPLLVTVLAAAGAYAVHRLFIGTALGQEVDTAALRGGDFHHPRVSEVLTRTLDATRLAVLALVCLMAAAFGVLRRRLDLAIASGFLVIAANLITQQLKAGLERPLLDGFPAPNSWPSGHATAAASAAFVLVLVFPRALRGTVGLVGAGYVAIVSVATVWAEWHRPSDVIAALLIVLACGSLAVFAVRLRRTGPAPAIRLPNRLVMVVLGVAAALAAATAAFGMGAVALSERPLPDLVSGRFAFLTGTAGIIAAVAVTVIVWVRLTAGEPTTAPTPQGDPK